MCCPNAKLAQSPLQPMEAAGPAPSLREVRLLAMYLIAFAGLLRCDEVMKSKCSAITINGVRMVLQVVSNKTDQ